MPTPLSDYFCTTTCGLWDTSILRPATKAVTCDEFMVTSAFPKGGELCKEECLLAELMPNRYPAPTGLGFFCAPGSCDPAVQVQCSSSRERTRTRAPAPARSAHSDPRPLRIPLLPIPLPPDAAPPVKTCASVY